MSTPTCLACGGWSCERCTPHRRELDVARAELIAARESLAVLKATLERTALEGEQWKRRYEALLGASRGVGY